MARLNLFQRIMLVWDEVLPYNAVHALRVDLALDVDRLREEIRATLEDCGYSCELDAIVLSEHEGGRPVEEIRGEVLCEELNRRFARDLSELPFRFFVIRGEADQFVLGVCYFHLVAGGDSICWLLEDLIGRYAGGERAPVGWSGLKAPRYRQLLLGHLRYFWGWALSFPADIRRSRRFARLPKSGADGSGIGMRTLRLSVEQREWMLQKSRGTEATFNDVLLCLALFAAVAVRPSRIRHKRRKNIAIGSIVNTRAHFGPKHAKTFGLFVAFTSVEQAVPEGISFDELLARVHEETELTKRERLYMRDLFKLGGSLLWMKSLSSEKQLNFYRKNYPLLAGVTSFFVDRFQTRLTELPVADYWRAVSASPANPLVLACTTFGKEANITLSYDQSVYSHDAVNAFVEQFLRAMDSDQQGK